MTIRVWTSGEGERSVDANKHLSYKDEEQDRTWLPVTRTRTFTSDERCNRARR